MRILIVSNVHWWNAEAAYAAKIAKLLNNKTGNSVFVLTRPGSLNEKHLRELGLRLVTDIDLNTINPLRLLFSFKKLKKFLRKERIELINAHRSEGFPLLIFAAFSFRFFHSGNSIPVIRTRGTNRTINNHWLNRKMHLDWTDLYITAGEIVRERLLKNVSIPQGKLKTIYYPVTTPELPLKPIIDYRTEFRISKKTKVLAVVGRIRPVKGQRILLQSFSQILLEFPNLVLLLPYRDTSESEPEMKKLRSDIDNLGLESHIRLIPERDDILQLMEFADIGVVSSVESEVICRVAVEFFSVATPVVAFPTGCLPEIIIDGKNGILVKSKTPEALTQAIKILLRNPKLCKRLGKAARQDAENRFHPQKMLNETLKVFEQSLNLYGYNA